MDARVMTHHDTTNLYAFVFSFSLAIIGTVIGEIHTDSGWEVAKEGLQILAWSVGILVGASNLWKNHRLDVIRFFQRFKF